MRFVLWALKVAHYILIFFVLVAVMIVIYGMIDPRVPEMLFRQGAGLVLLTIFGNFAFGHRCPLTMLENWVRRRVGKETVDSQGG